MRSRIFILVLLALACALPRPVDAEGEKAPRRNAIVKIVEQKRDAVVSIRTNEIVTRTWFDIWDRPYRQEPYEREGGLGSGAIFHPGGYVITNAHVISRASRIFVGITRHDEKGNGKPDEHQALPLAIDIANDLAILRLLPDQGEIPKKYPYIKMGRSDDLMVGENVVAMGHPFRLGLTVTQGIVSGLDRKLKLRNHVFSDFMQVDAAINPGNSGGPLFDITGRWIGVNTAIYNRAFGAEGIGFAIPADRVRALIATAFKRRVVAPDWLGVELESGPNGEALIQRIYPKGPARGSGLHTGDVVAAVNGVRTPTLYDLRMQLVAASPDRAIAMEVIRSKGVGPRAEAKVQLESVPTNDLSSNHLGFLAQDTGEFQGVVVAKVLPKGPAYKMALRRGDVIYGLGRWEIRNTEDLLMFLQFVSSGDLVDVKVRRPGQREPLSGVLEAE